MSYLCSYFAIALNTFAVKNSLDSMISSTPTANPIIKRRAASGSLNRSPTTTASSVHMQHQLATAAILILSRRRAHRLLHKAPLTTSGQTHSPVQVDLTIQYLDRISVLNYNPILRPTFLMLTISEILRLPLC